MGWARAAHELVIYLHQDVFLPQGWDRLIVRQYQMAQRQFGPIGVAGVYGVGEVVTSDISGRLFGTERIGWVVDRGRVLSEGPGLPAPVATLDELLLIVPRNTSLRVDPALGFHLYGADLCLQARERGLAVVALVRRAATTRGPADYRWRSWRVPKCLPASGPPGCPWRRPAWSSTATAMFTCCAIPSRMSRRLRTPKTGGSIRGPLSLGPSRIKPDQRVLRGIPDSGFPIPDFEFPIPGSGFETLDFGFEIPDFRFRIGNTVDRS